METLEVYGSLVWEAICAMQGTSGMAYLSKVILVFIFDGPAYLCTLYFPRPR